MNAFISLTVTKVEASSSIASNNGCILRMLIYSSAQESSTADSFGRRDVALRSVDWPKMARKFVLPKDAEAKDVPAAVL